MASFLGGTPYTKRPVPTDPAGLAAWLAVELGNLQRRTASASSRTVTGNTTVLATDGLILCDCTAGALSVTWPTPLPQTKDWVTIVKKIDGSANAVTLVGTFDGVVNPTLAAQYKSKTVWSDGTRLNVVATT